MANLTTRDRVQRRRDKLRAAGLRPVQIWVPDTRAPGFAEECRRQGDIITAAQTAETRAEDEAWFIASIEGWGDDV